MQLRTAGLRPAPVSVRDEGATSAGSAGLAPCPRHWSGRGCDSGPQGSALPRSRSRRGCNAGPQGSALPPIGSRRGCDAGPHRPPAALSAPWGPPGGLRPAPASVRDEGATQDRRAPPCPRVVRDEGATQDRTDPHAALSAPWGPPAGLRPAHVSFATSGATQDRRAPPCPRVGSRRGCDAGPQGSALPRGLRGAGPPSAALGALRRALARHQSTKGRPCRRSPARDPTVSGPGRSGLRRNSSDTGSLAQALAHGLERPAPDARALVRRGSAASTLSRG